jgi:2-keto-3-deoxy-L-rhamnonate aldolase RhmA
MSSKVGTLKQRIARHDLVLGVMVFEFFTPGIAQLAKAAGAEFVFYDMEHGGIGIETIKSQCSFCRDIGIAPLVRVPVGEYHFIARALDAGAHGIMVPMVESSEQARHIVACTRYPPDGRRGAAFGFAHDDYLPGAPSEKISAAHARTLVIPMIETPGGVANVEAIAATPGVDVLWVGHFDLTNFMGIPGQFEHPEYLAAIDKIAAAARRNNKAAGFMAIDESWSARYHALGFRVFAYSSDMHVFQRGLATGLKHLRSLG